MVSIVTEDPRLARWPGAWGDRMAVKRIESAVFLFSVFDGSPKRPMDGLEFALSYKYLGAFLGQ